MDKNKNELWQIIARAISAATGSTFQVESRQAVSGGSINHAVKLDGAHCSYFVKLNTAERLAMFQAEAAGLEALRSSRSLRVPAVVTAGSANGTSWLVLEHIDLCPPQASTSSLLGARLAAMHRAGAGAFGWDRDNTIGATPQLNAWTGDWLDFLGQQRLAYQLALAATNGAPLSLTQKGERLLERLPVFFRGYEPQPALLHGDLWAGNWGADTDGNPVIFDPAVYFGDREADIAMTELFGGFDAQFYQSYEAAWPLCPGYENRKTLYNLYHILNHFNLFGGGYARQAQSMIDRLLADCTA